MTDHIKSELQYHRLMIRGLEHRVREDIDYIKQTRTTIEELNNQLGEWLESETYRLVVISLPESALSN